MIKDIILYIVIALLVASNIYLIYKTRNVEHFSTTDNINQSINDIYKADINAIRNLSNFATEIYTQNDSFVMPAKSTTIKDLTVNGDITFINKNTGIMEIFPEGMVIAWAKSTIPKGWALCDGKKYKLDSDYIAQEVLLTDTTGTVTPDLRGRFVLGSGFGANDMNNVALSNRDINTTGGSEMHKLTVDEIPSHTHASKLGHEGNARYGWNAGMATHFYHYDVGIGVPTGGDKSHNNMPPYYVLTYIMKL